LRILLTGASGQLGHKITNCLQNYGIEVTTLGRKPINSRTLNYSWSLGMSPNPQAFVGIDCVLHLAWSTTDRGDYDFHLNVGGSKKIFEAADLLRVRIVNFSSLSVINPMSRYGKAKNTVEDANLRGLNLRIAKLEEPFFKSDLHPAKNILRKIVFIPVPRGLGIQVVEFDQLLSELIKHIEETSIPSIYTLSYERYELREYFKKYHGLSSFYVPKRIVSAFFICCKLSRTRYGNLLHDRWLSLTSTDQALCQKVKSF
jgi:hypothetical protein